MNNFMEATASFEEAQIIILGGPYDGTCTYRPGARFGPVAIRQASHSLETWSPILKRDLCDVAYHDAGDLTLPPNASPEAILEILATEAGRIVDAKKVPMLLGGEHLISLPVIQKVFEAAQKQNQDLHLIHLDGHADLREEYEGNPLSHATVIRRVLDFLPPDHLYQFGIRSGIKAEFEWMQGAGTLYEPAAIGEVVDRIGDEPVYITIDLDILDPSVLPGTGTPEPGGWSFAALYPFFQNFSRLPNIVGMDIMELSPPCDPSGVSNVVAAKVCREMLLSVMNEIVS